MAPAQIALWTPLAVALLVSVATDLASRRILDVVTYPTAAVELALRCWSEGVGDPDKGLLCGVLGIALGAVPLALFAWRGRMGWGDVKLMAVVGAALGFPLVLAALMFVSLAGALQAVVVLAVSGALKQSLQRWARGWAARLRLAAAGPAESSRQIPYGVAIALGTFGAMWWDLSGTR